MLSETHGLPKRSNPDDLRQFRAAAGLHFIPCFYVARDGSGQCGQWIFSRVSIVPACISVFFAFLSCGAPEPEVRLWSLEIWNA